MKKLTNIIMILLICWIGARELGLFNPLVGLELKPDKFKNVANNKIMTLPDHQNALWVYWASWCAPCKLEMERLARADINHSRVFAINMGESVASIQNFIAKNSLKYPFTFLVGGEKSAKILDVSVTPSVYHLKGNKVTWSRTRRSLLGIIRAEHLIPKLENNREK